MNINIQKVVKCLTSISAVFAVAVMYLSAPAKAAIYNISDFFEYNVIDKETDTRTAYFEVDVSPFSRVYDSTNTLVASGYGSIDWKFPHDSITQHTFTASIYHFGGVLWTDANASDYVLDVSDIMDGTEITLSADLDCRFTTTNKAADLDFQYRTFIIAYDANMKLISRTNTAWSSSTLPKEATREIENSLAYTLPKNTFYIGMITQTKWTFPYDIDSLSLAMSPQPVVLSVAVDMVYEQSQTMNKISNQLDEIFTGGSAGDALGNSTDNMDKDNDKLGDALDDYHGAADQLPTTPADLDDVIDKDAIQGAVDDAAQIFDWDASGLTYMYVPMGISLSLSVLFYVVFGKD